VAENLRLSLRRISSSLISSVKVHLEKMEKDDKSSIGKIEAPPQLSKEELVERAYKRKWRELKIARMRAGVLKNQIARAYEIIENIRFDFLGDTMFRDYFVSAKRSLEGAMSDHLLSDVYWEKKIKEHRKMTFEKYDKKVKEMSKGFQGEIKEK